MDSTSKLSECYVLPKIKVEEDGYYYSKIELIATGNISFDDGETGIQMRVYNALRNSLIAGELSQYPEDISMRISSISDEYSTQIFDSVAGEKRTYNLEGLTKLLALMDTTSAKNVKLFSGFDGRRWDFIADMDAKKAVISIKNSLDASAISGYLEPFVPEDLKRRYIAMLVERNYMKRKG